MNSQFILEPFFKILLYKNCALLTFKGVGLFFKNPICYFLIKPIGKTSYKWKQVLKPYFSSIYDKLII